MEHGQQTGESIGAMLSSIAATLREVSDKLDAVAARMDGAPAVADEQTIESRLAKLEAWAFHAGQDISGIDTRVERLESGEGTPFGDRESVDERPAPVPRAAAGRRGAGQRERHAAPAQASGSGESRESSRGHRNGVPRQNTPRESVHLAEELNSAPPSGFTPPREPVVTALEPNATSGQSFTAPAPNFTAHTPREPAPNFTAPISREPALDLPTAREPITAQQESLTAPREPVATPQPSPSRENPAYESIIASVDDASPDGNHGRSENGTTPDVHATGLTGAHRATDEDRMPVENSHVDKLQAMLDELKRTAATPLSRSDIFGPPAGDPDSTGYQSDRTDPPRRSNDYRLSSPPPVS
ncbi:hypothetical protein OHB12_13005 [Nocardia sp. NBC_01730]|uniref:hypothetical protein n=1 Tax=Nocardia sp. NBC_01730 TaxID=2975998 RepID=UPI002E15FE60|nr:hypothetical protein OHB12_13005 [Nocardia sp. NBC_01730]